MGVAMRNALPIFMILSLMVQPVWAKAPVVGDLAPAFSVTSLLGKKISLDELKGKVVLIGMFHICVPCQLQALEFEKVRQAVSSDKLAIIGINTAGDSKKNVEDYLAGFPSPIHFPYYLDPGQMVHKAYIQRDMPTVLIVGPEGKLLARSPSVTAKQLIPYIKKLL